MIKVVGLLIGLLASGAAQSGELITQVQVPRMAMQTARQPRIESLGARSSARQFYMPETLEIGLSGLGAPGQVQVSVHPFTDFPPGSMPLPGAALPTGCYFSGGSLAAPAVINADGTATARFSGHWFPSRRDQVSRDGLCRIEVRVRRLQPDLSYREEARIVSNLIPIAAHEAVRVTSTARLRAFLKPVASPRCAADDAGDKFGIRISAGMTPQACRTDFLKPTGDYQATLTGNPLGPGQIITAVTWKLEGDTGRCELCANPLSPCRGITPQALLAESVGAEVVRWVYAPVRVGENGNGHRYAVFTGPPTTPSGTLIRIDTHDYDYNTSLPDYLDRLHAVAVGNQQGYEAAVIGRADALWRSWLRPFGIGLACSAWTPPSVSTAKGAVSGAIGQLSQGQLPTPPPAPSLRLVLDEMYLLRPVGQKLPWDN